jgi:hypothetical protein
MNAEKAELVLLKPETVSHLSQIGYTWWMEVTTTQPPCTYHFGPFKSCAIAGLASLYYIEEFRNMGIQEVEVLIKRCQLNL